MAPDGPDEEDLKRENLKQVSRQLQMGWHDNKKVYKQDWLSSGLSRYVSNSSRDRRFGPRFESPLGITISIIQNWNNFLLIKQQDAS